MPSPIGSCESVLLHVAGHADDGLPRLAGVDAESPADRRRAAPDPPRQHRVDDDRVRAVAGVKVRPATSGTPSVAK